MADDLKKLVRTYRINGLADRSCFAEEIFQIAEQDLRFFVANAVRTEAADDVPQEILIAIAELLNPGRLTVRAAFRKIRCYRSPAKSWINSMVFLFGV